VLFAEDLEKVFGKRRGEKEADIALTEVVEPKKRKAAAKTPATKTAKSKPVTSRKKKSEE
jgi:hypothetical protein